MRVVGWKSRDTAVIATALADPNRARAGSSSRLSMVDSSNRLSTADGSNSLSTAGSSSKLSMAARSSPGIIVRTSMETLAGGVSHKRNTEDPAEDVSHKRNMGDPIIPIIALPIVTLVVTRRLALDVRRTDRKSPTDPGATGKRVMAPGRTMKTLMVPDAIQSVKDMVRPRMKNLSPGMVAARSMAKQRTAVVVETVIPRLVAGVTGNRSLHMAAKSMVKERSVVVAGRVTPPAGNCVVIVVAARSMARQMRAAVKIVTPPLAVTEAAVEAPATKAASPGMGETRATMKVTLPATEAARPRLLVLRGSTSTKMKAIVPDAETTKTPDIEG